MYQGPIESKGVLYSLRLYRIADQGGVDPDPTFEKIYDPDSTVKKKNHPDPALKTTLFRPNFT